MTKSGNFLPQELENFLSEPGIDMKISVGGRLSKFLIKNEDVALNFLAIAKEKRVRIVNIQDFYSCKGDYKFTIAYLHV